MDTALCTATRLEARCSGVRIPTRAGELSLLLHFQSRSTTHPVTCSVSTAVICPGYGGRGVKTTHLYLAKLRVSVDVLLFPLYVSMAWAGVTTF